MVLIYTHSLGEETMRTNVVLNDDLIAEAMKLPGINTKKRAIEEGLKLLVRLNRQAGIRSFRGKLKWTGDLDRTRTNR
jgi:Arc/MetJ family transcription regulator